ncbi:uncharacterized protein FFMR_11916 [Fusarium fujikuroi]|nr:uncharacterized protein FFMR_11916 [Fusarium fujikuroi]
MAQQPVTQNQGVQNPVAQDIQQPVTHNQGVQNPVAQHLVVKDPHNKEPESECPDDESSEDEYSEDEDQHPVVGISAVAPPSTHGFETKQPLFPLSRRGAPSRGRNPTTRRAKDCPKQKALNEALKTKSDADKVVARKMKKYWDQHSAELPEEMKDSFISAFQKIRKTTSNAKSPSNHMIWKNTLSSCKEDLDWAKWIVLRAVYYDPVANSKEPGEQMFRANFMKNEVSKRIQQRYPGVNVFTAKVPNDLSAPRPSTWPMIGDTDGFLTVKEETPIITRSRSETVAPPGGIALPGKSSAGVKRKLNNSSAVEPATPAKVPRFTSRLQDAEEEIEEDKYLEKYSRHRSLQQRKPESFEPRPAGHEMSFVTQVTGNKFEPPLQTLEEKAQRHPAAVKDLQVVKTATGKIIEPPLQNLEKKAQRYPAAFKDVRMVKTSTGNKFEPLMQTLAEGYQNHPAAVENRLVARTTEHVKNELGFTTKDDLLLYCDRVEGSKEASASRPQRQRTPKKNTYGQNTRRPHCLLLYICQQMRDNMVVPQNILG